MDFSKIKPINCVVNDQLYEYKEEPSKYLFVDFDGTVRHTLVNSKNQRVKKGNGASYKRVPPNSVDQVKVYPIQDKLKEWIQVGYRIVGVTNQSGIQMGFISMETCKDICKETVKQLGVPFPVIFAPCKDGPIALTHLRKPDTGMVELAEKLFGPIDRKRSLLVGDYKSDIQMGKAANLRTFQVDPSKEGKDFPTAKKMAK